MTQTDNSLAIAEQKKKDQEHKAREEEERRRIEAERRAAEDKRRKEQEAIDKANMDGMFGNNNSSGSGTSTGITQQGNPVGQGSSGGNSWSLTGRSLIGKLVTPSYDKNEEGKITVSIRVDQNGKVTVQSIDKPTTISDVTTRNAALNAARNTRFTSGKDISTGSITYNFNLR
jgi:TonB family protein